MMRPRSLKPIFSVRSLTTMTIVNPYRRALSVAHSVACSESCSSTICPAYVWVYQPVSTRCRSPVSDGSEMGMGATAYLTSLGYGLDAVYNEDKDGLIPGDLADDMPVPRMAAELRRINRFAVVGWRKRSEIMTTWVRLRQQWIRRRIQYGSLGTSSDGLPVSECHIE